MKPSDLAHVVVDTTVQPKNVTFPTDAKLVNRAREKLVRLGVDLRQSYARVGKIELIRHQRYVHARHLKRAKKALRKLKTYLGRVNRDIKRKIADNDFLHTKFASLLNLAGRMREQERSQRGPKLYSLHAPEVECIGKFGVKVSVATTLKRCKGGQFAIHAPALPGNPYDGYTFARVILAIEKLVGTTIERIHADAGYRGHNPPSDYKFKVYTSKQKRGVTRHIQPEMRRRSAIEPVISHIEHEHRMERNYLTHRHGDANNAILAAAGYDFSLLIRWLRFLLRLILALLGAAPKLAVA